MGICPHYKFSGVVLNKYYKNMKAATYERAFVQLLRHLQGNDSGGWERAYHKQILGDLETMGQIWLNHNRWS